MTRPPHTTPPIWGAIAAGRFAEQISSDSSRGRRIALVGLPDELGVKLNGGRPGASHGPAAFRAALAKFGVGYDATLAREIPADLVWDAGDVHPADGGDAGALEETHSRVTVALRAIHDMGMTPVCIGGGHDLTLPTVRALAQSGGGPVGGMNVDAHLDVRDAPGSGMPFRALIEGGHVAPARFITVGAGRFANTKAHAEYLLKKQATILSIDHTLSSEFDASHAFEIASSEGAAFVSIDLDSIDGAQAPGVSAVNPMGLPVSLACQIAARAGAHPDVRHFDLMELSPIHDDPRWNAASRNSAMPGRTARIAALLFLYFVAGFTERDS